MYAYRNPPAITNPTIISWPNGNWSLWIMEMGIMTTMPSVEMFTIA